MSKIIDFLQYKIQRYNPKKYWKYRLYIQNKDKNRIIRLLKLFYLKRCDAFNCASTGASLDEFAIFKGPLHLPHGLNGIIISRYAIIGKDVKIYQQVTIGQNEKGEAPIIGDNVVIYPGARIIGNVKIGNNSIVGTNAVVTHDVEENVTVAGVPAKIIKRN